MTLGTTTARQTEWGFRSPDAAWLLPLLLVAAVVYAIWLYRGTTLQRRWRIALLTVRAAVLAIVLAMLFQPLLVVHAASQVRQHVLVLLDISESMSLRDQRQRSADRAEAALAVGDRANRHADVQRALGRGLRELRRAVQSLERAQLPDLFAAHNDWRSALGDIQGALDRLEAGGAAELRPQVQRWADEAEQMQERVEAAVGDGELAEEPRRELLDEYGATVDAVDEQIAGMAAAVLQDGSTPRGSDANPSRHEMARGLLSERDDSVFDQLDGRHQVHYYTFGQNLRPTGDDAPTPRGRLLASQPDEQSTRLGSALDDAVARHAGQPITGIVLLSDGGSNLGLDPLAVAQRLGERSIPVHTVGLGLPEPPDVSLEQMIAPPVAFVRDEVPVRAQVRAVGFQGRNVNVIAELDGQIVGEQSITLQDGRQWVEFAFPTDEPVDAGELRLSISELQGEVSHANNSRRQVLRVIDEKINVLYVEGKPRWEFRYLRAVLLRDHRLDVKLLMTEGDRELAQISSEHLAGLPSDPEALFEYDLVILGDVPSSYFSRRQLEMLQELVRERGGALAMIAGRDHAPGSYEGTPLSDVLPVRLASRRHVAVEDSARWRVTAAGRRSAITRLVADESRNDEIWRLVHPIVRLPELDGAKPGATVLAELDNSRLGTPEQPYPLLAWHRYGSGRSLFIATDQLWRLRFRRGDEYHARYWSQAIQFLTLARVMGDAQRIQISTDAEEYRAGQRVRVSAHVLGESFEPLPASEYQVELQQREPQTAVSVLQLEPVPGSPGLFETSFVAEEGLFRIRDIMEPDEATTASYRVEQVPLEMIDPAMQENLLRQVAERSGGRFFRTADLPALPELLEPQPRPVTVRRERELWSQPWLLVLLLALLGGEWFVRRRYQQL